MKQKRLCIAAGVAVGVAMGAYALWQGLHTVSYQIVSNRVKQPVRLALVADLHSTWYGDEQIYLIKTLEAVGPDVILMAGDMIDDKRERNAIDIFLNGISTSYPCFYALGNHEFRISDPKEVKQWARARGVTVLDGMVQQVSIKGQSLYIAGMDDWTCGNTLWDKQRNQVCSQIKDCDGYTILISHRPELLNLYRSSGFDLVVSGHAHGGQVRVPGLLNGLFAPGQGTFPMYAGGIYSLGHTQLVVSRGLCRNFLPRVFNRPELVVVDILPQ